MTPERHAEQVFDLIADGKFYLVTDNVRPYVDHDLPFDAMNIITERFDNLRELQLTMPTHLKCQQKATRHLS